MQRVLGSALIGLAILVSSGTAFAQVGSTDGASGELEPMQTLQVEKQNASSMLEESPTAKAASMPDTAEDIVAQPAIAVFGSAELLELCTNLEHLALRWIESGRQKRNAIDEYATRFWHALAERVVHQLGQLTENERQQFDAEVAEYAQRREFTLRLQDERDMREALQFAHDFELQEKKRVFAQQLEVSRPPASVAPTVVVAADVQLE